MQPSRGVNYHTCYPNVTSTRVKRNGSNANVKCGYAQPCLTRYMQLRAPRAALFKKRGYILYNINTPPYVCFIRYVLLYSIHSLRGYTRDM